MRVLALLLLASVARAGILPAPVSIITSTPIVVNQGTNPWNITGSTIIVTVASNVTLGSSTANIGLISYQASDTPIITTATISGSDQTVLLTSLTRKAIECKTDCTNKATVYYRFNASAASGAVEALGPCSSWQPPPGVSVTGSLHFYAPSGSQTVRCTEY